ncbi:MAG TPA: hypothetical protein VL134_00850, partial [Leptolyngbya sp.]|nr:hypothetical protein [Leptolyngbya sp.]
LAEPDRSFYQALIYALAQQYNAPLFQPHLTIHSGDLALAEASQLLQSIDIVLEIAQIKHSDQFTKTLFIQFFSNPELTQLSKLFQHHFHSVYDLDPHLSLIYAPPSERWSEMEKRSLTQNIQPRDRVIRFDRIAAMIIPTPPQTREDVEAWQEIV